MQNDADNIVPFLWLGNFKAATDASFLRNNNIRFVLNCTRQRSPLRLYDDLGIQSFQFFLDDSDDQRNNDTLVREALLVQQHIDEYISKGMNVLVHCHAGMQRSATMVAVYLMVKYGCNDIDNIIYFIKSRRPIAFGNRATFRNFLANFCASHRSNYLPVYY
jgi:hypothetical protein